MSKITPFLWFDNNAEDAINLYVSVFKNSKIISLDRRAPDAPIFSGSFILDGQNFKALNGGPRCKFNEAISFMVSCESQSEVDHLWAKLADGGEEKQCGWVQDKFGISWQIIPSEVEKCLRDSDPIKSQRAFAALLQMKKVEIETIKKAYEGN